MRCLQVNQVLNKARDDAGNMAQQSLRDTNNVVRTWDNEAAGILHPELITPPGAATVLGQLTSAVAQACTLPRRACLPFALLTAIPGLTLCRCRCAW